MITEEPIIKYSRKNISLNIYIRVSPRTVQNLFLLEVSPLCDFCQI